MSEESAKKRDILKEHAIELIIEQLKRHYASRGCRPSQSRLKLEAEVRYQEHFG